VSIENAIARESFPPRTRQEPDANPAHHDGNGADSGESGTKLVRLKKPVVLRPDVGVRVDSTMVGPQFYDCFNYTLLTQGDATVNAAIAVSSANPGEGKTLAACNLAISLTVAYQRKTVLVDMNVHKPRLHEIFDVPVGPGLLEAVGGSPIHVARTAITDLYVLTGGVVRSGLAGGIQFTLNDAAAPLEPSFQLEQIAAFRDVVYSLKEQFDFVIIDMPALREHLVPLLFTNQLDGILLVVHGDKTKHGELSNAIEIVNKHRILGFVYNGAERPRRSLRFPR
jgi:Mrp family chromosome partitioning ATPase